MFRALMDPWYNRGISSATTDRTGDLSVRVENPHALNLCVSGSPAYSLAAVVMDLVTVLVIALSGHL